MSNEQWQSLCLIQLQLHEWLDEVSKIVMMQWSLFVFEFSFQKHKFKKREINGSSFILTVTLTTSKSCLIFILNHINFIPKPTHLFIIIFIWPQCVSFLDAATCLHLSCRMSHTATRRKQLSSWSHFILVPEKSIWFPL